MNIFRNMIFHEAGLPVGMTPGALEALLSSHALQPCPPLAPTRGAKSKIGSHDAIACAALTKPRTCRICGCTDMNCRGCIVRTGKPCYWVSPNLCSACADGADDFDVSDEDNNAGDELTARLGFRVSARNPRDGARNLRDIFGGELEWRHDPSTEHWPF